MTLKNLFEKTVFLLGAGASMDAGCLSSNGMLTDLKERIRAMPATNEWKEPFESIHDFIIASLHYQNSIRIPDNSNLNNAINIEDFVMVLRQLIDREYMVPQPLVGNWNNKIIGWELKYKNVFTKFLDYITALLIDNWTNYDRNQADKLMAPIRNLIETPEVFTTDIFVLNYDVIWENCFNSDTEKLVENGFSGNRWTGEFEDPHHPAKILLSKLHGSTDWYFDPETEEVRVSQEPVGEPLIIFGSSYKMQSFDPFISLLSRFRQRLQTATLYVIIGYSFQDRYINNILIQSLGSQLARSAIVVDPDSWKTAEELVKNVEEIQSSKSLNEMLNLKKINPQKIEIIKMTAKEFYAKYFENNARILQDKLERIEQEDTVF